MIASSALFLFVCDIIEFIYKRRGGIRNDTDAAMSHTTICSRAKTNSFFALSLCNDPPRNEE